MRDRLIELLNRKYDHFCDQCGVNKDSHYTENLADYLLANGVIVPPVKVGQSIYRISINGKEIYGDWRIIELIVYEDEMGFLDDSDNWIDFEDIGKTVFLTKEEAEAALKGGEEL